MVEPEWLDDMVCFIDLAEIKSAMIHAVAKAWRTEVARFAEEDFSDVRLDESGWDPEIIAANLKLYERLWAGRRPTYGRSLIDLGKAEKYSFEWALFPLSEDGVHVDCSLSVDDFTPLAGCAHAPR